MTYILIHSFGKNWFSLSQKLSIVKNFLMRGVTLCPLLFLCAAILSGLSLFKSCVCYLGLSEFLWASAPAYLENAFFFWVTNLLWLLNFFCPLSHKDLRALNWRALMKTTHLPLSPSLSSCCSSVLTTVDCNKKLLWWGFSDALIHGYRNMYLVVVSLLCSPCRRIVVDFPIWPIGHDLSSVRLLAPLTRSCMHVISWNKP